jgi:hypothetical protein
LIVSRYYGNEGFGFSATCLGEEQGGIIDHTSGQSSLEERNDMIWMFKDRDYLVTAAAKGNYYEAQGDEYGGEEL